MARKTVEAVEGFPVMLDSGTDTYAEFDAGGAVQRQAYRTGYVFPVGTFRVKVTPGDDYEVLVRPYVAARHVTIMPGMTLQTIDALLTDDTDVTWAAGTVTTLDGVLTIRRRNVRFLQPAFLVAPAAGKQAAIRVSAPGFRIEQPTVTVRPTKRGAGKLPGCDLFQVRAGGSLACRGGTFTSVNTFLHVEAGHGGVVIEHPTLLDLRAYALYTNGGDAGISWFGGTVAGPGNEPFFRCMERDPVRSPTGNVYLGHVKMTRLDPAKRKDGITPRGVQRFAGDRCILENCQFRSGQDASAVAEGDNPDPHDVLLYGCTITHAYAEHKRGAGLARRIHLIANSFEHPMWKPPIGISACTGAVVNDNRWIGGPAGPWLVRRVGRVADLVESNNLSV